MPALPLESAPTSVSTLTFGVSSISTVAALLPGVAPCLAPTKTPRET